MIKNDYILRLIEQMGDFYRRLLNLQKDGKFEECHGEIDEKFRQLGVSRALVRALPPEELTALLGRRDASFAKRCTLLAGLARADGSVYEAEGRPQAALNLYQTALGVLMQAEEAAEPEEEQKILSRKQEVEYDISRSTPDERQGL